MHWLVGNFVLIAEILIVFICLANTFDKQISVDIYLIILIISEAVLLMGINEQGIFAYLSLLVYAVLFLYALLHYKSSIKVTLINCFISVAVTGIIQLIFCIPIFFLLRGVGEYKGINELVTNLGGLLFAILLKDKVHLKVFSDFLQQKGRIFKIGAASLTVYLAAKGFSDDKYSVLKNMNIMQMSWIITLFFYMISEWQKIKSDADKKDLQLQMNSLYYSAYDELLERVRENQHDMKNHITAILGMVYTIDNYDDLVRRQKEYCNDMIENDRGTELLLTTKNPLIAGFLYKKIQEISQKNIEVDYKIAIDKNLNIISEYELVEILGILLDNAAEALEGGENTVRKIYVELINSEADTRIIVANTGKSFENSQIREFFQKDFTSKGKGHGIGLKKLKKIVHGKGGEIMAANQQIDGDDYTRFTIIIRRGAKGGSC